MVYTIYGDVLAAINFIIDLALLRLTARLTHLNCRGARPYIASALGAAMSFMVFLPQAPLWGELLIRAGGGALLVLAAFGRMPPRVFIRVLAAFMAVSFAAGGAATLSAGIFSGGWLYRNGAFYYSISPLLLLGCIVGAYALIDFCGRLFSERAKSEDIHILTITRGGAVVKIPALADSGNRLRERFSGLPMVIAAKESVLPLLRAEERPYITSSICDGLPPTLRLVVYEGVGGAGVLKAFRADAIETDRSSASFDGYVAVTDREFAGGYCAIFNPDMIRIAL